MTLHDKYKGLVWFYGPYRHLQQ